MRHWYKQLLALLALLSLSQLALAAGEIRMISVRSNACPPVSGCYASNFFEAMLEVQNLAYAKQVGIRYRNASGVWVNQAGEFSYSVTGNREVWHVSLSQPPSAYAFYYTVNGVTYWDNNSGKNYASAAYQYDGLLGTLPVGEPIASWKLDNNSQTAGAVTGDVLVKNLGYGKTVKVVYTFDNWVTSREVQAAYLATLPSGFEAWSFRLPASQAPDFSKVKIAFYYSWGSGSAWDNNYGRNYSMQYYGYVVR